MYKLSRDMVRVLEAWEDRQEKTAKQEAFRAGQELNSN